MTVYKYYLKSFAKMKMTFIIWIGMFTIITIAMGGIPDEKEKPFDKITYHVAMSDSVLQDELALSSAFRSSTDIININDNEFEAKEAVFLDDVSLALIKDDNGKINCYSNPANQTAFIAKSDTQNYLEFLSATAKDGNYQPELAKQITHISIKPHLLEKKQKRGYREIWYEFTFRFLSYPLMAVIMSIIGMSIISFRKPLTDARSSISSKKLLSINAQTFLAQIIGMLIIVSLVLGIITAIGGIANIDYVAYLSNILAFSLSSISMIFLLASINMHKNFIGSVGNILPLCLGFISGVSVPSEFLPKFAVILSKFFPMYYYIKGNELAADGFSKELGLYIVIQLLFAVCLFLAGVFVSKLKKNTKHL